MHHYGNVNSGQYLLDIQNLVTFWTSLYVSGSSSVPMNACKSLRQAWCVIRFGLKYVFCLFYVIHGVVGSVT